MLKKSISRAKFLETLANIPPCLVGLEACGGAHHWAREIGKLGHQVRIIAPQFVSPYRKSGKNDANDAEAICEAVARPNTGEGLYRCQGSGSPMLCRLAEPP